MPTTITTTPGVPAGSTVYAVVSRGGSMLATFALAEAPAGTFTGTIPASVSAGDVRVDAYRQFGAAPAPATDHRVAVWIVEVPAAPAVSTGRDVLKSGLAWLTSQLKSHAMQDVTYVRGGDRVALRAHFGEKLLKLDDGAGGIVMEWTDLDLLIPAADLILGGVAVEPERGDQIRVADESSGSTRIYEVARFGGEPPWRYADPHRSIIRVHTKFVEVEEPC